MQIKIYIFCFLFGCVVTLSAGYFFFVRPSSDRDTEYRKQQSELISRNTELKESNKRTREDISELERKLSDSEARYIALYRKSQEGINSQREIIGRAETLIRETTDSLQRLRIIMEAFREIKK